MQNKARDIVIQEFRYPPHRDKDIAMKPFKPCSDVDARRIAREEIADALLEIRSQWQKEGSKCLLQSVVFGRVTHKILSKIKKAAGYKDYVSDEPHRK